MFLNTRSSTNYVWGQQFFGYEWSKTFGGSGEDHGNSVQQTTDGDYIIVGTTKSFGAGEDDVYLIKTDPLGNELWSKTFGGGKRDWGNWVQQTTDGGYIILGTTEFFGTVGDWDIYLIKTDANGNEMWSKTFDGELGWAGNPLQQTTDGGYIITGFYRIPYPVSYPDQDVVYLIKTDTDGNEMWSKTFDELGGGGGFGVRQTTDDGYIIVGVTGGFLGPGVKTDVYLIKTDADGNEIWSKQFDGDYLDWGFSVQRTTDGGYVIAGYTGFWDVDWETPIRDVYLIKTDVNGNEMWSKTFGGSEDDEGRSVQQTADDGYIIAGSTNTYGSGKSDVYLIKTDSSGNESWSKTFGGSEDDEGRSVQQTNDGGFIVTGTESQWAGGSVYLIYYNPITCNEKEITILGTESHDFIKGTAGPDVIHGLGGHDVIYGMGGDDVICGGEGADHLSGWDGNDYISGGKGHDVLQGCAGDDELWGNWGNDTLMGGSGYDVLWGGTGPSGGTQNNNDTCYDSLSSFIRGCEVFYER